MDIEITRHTGDGDSDGSYRLLVDGNAGGELDYVESGGVRTFTHTGVRPHLRGHGLAAVLVQRGLDDARAEGVGVVGGCSYVAEYLASHPDQGD